MASWQLNTFARDNRLVYSGRFPIAHQHNQRTTTNLDLSYVEAFDQPGAYLAVLRVPGHYDYRYDVNFFTVSDIGLQVRKSAEVMHVYTHSIATGEPIAQAEILLYNNNGF